MPLTSPRLQRAVPAPVIRMAPTSGSSPRSLIWVRSAGVSLSDMALRASGRLSVISATPSRTTHKSSVVPVSISMGLSPPHDIPDHRTHRQDRASHHGLSRLRSGRRAAADLLPWLARALAVLAAPAAGDGSSWLPLHRARHARLWPLQHLHAPRGLCPGADRRGHA